MWYWRTPASLSAYNAFLDSGVSSDLSGISFDFSVAGLGDILVELDFSS